MAIAIRERDAAKPDTASEVLSLLADADRSPIGAGDVAVIVAHPDDETVGCGAQLHRLQLVTVIVVTDGAPRAGGDARSNGYDNVAAYAAARSQELASALAIANVPRLRLVELGFADQSAGQQLVAIARKIDSLITGRDIKVVLTHAFEGGHPDHDATALAVHAVATLKRRRGQELAVIEMPFYHADGEGWVTQRFSRCPGPPAIAARLNDFEQAMKREMLAAHKTQHDTLAPFDAELECFRRAPHYDFSSLPNGGRLLYERYDWGMTSGRWLTLANKALRDLGLANRWH